MCITGTCRCYTSPLPPFLPLPLQRLPDVVNMEELSRKDLAAEPSKLEQLAAENQALQSRITALHEEASRGAKGKGRDAEKEELLAEISRLRDLAQSASKVGMGKGIGDPRVVLHQCSGLGW